MNVKNGNEAFNIFYIKDIKLGLPINFNCKNISAHLGEGITIYISVPDHQFSLTFSASLESGPYFIFSCICRTKLGHHRIR